MHYFWSQKVNFFRDFLFLIIGKFAFIYVVFEIIYSIIELNFAFI